MRASRSTEKKSGNGRIFWVLLLLVILISAIGAKSNIIESLRGLITPSHKEFKELVRKVIIDDPKFFLEALQEAQSQEMQKMQNEVKEKIKNNLSEIQQSDFTPVFGQEKSAITIAYFFDYNCGYCKKANSILNKLLKQNPDIKIVYKELPILGSQSRKLAQAALAVYSLDKNKYQLFHDALMSTANITDNTIEQILKTLGISILDFEQAKNNPKITQELDQINQLAAAVGVDGTPAFIINEDLLPGIDEYILEKKIEQLRNEQK